MPLTFKEALRFAESRRVELPSEYYGTLQGRAKDLAFSIAGVASRDQLQGVLDSLKDVQTQGLTFSQWQEKVKGGEIGLDLPAHRLDNIFRTNMQVHYNAGHWQQQQRFKSTRPYLMYDAVNDSRTRPSHLSLDNVIRPIDDAFWASHYPSNGYRCRCSTISMTEAQARSRGGVTEEPTEGWPKTDKGWDHNAAADPGAGVEQALHSTKPGDSAALSHAAETSVAEKTSSLRALEGASRDTMSSWLAGSAIDKKFMRLRDSLLDEMAKDGRTWDPAMFAGQPVTSLRALEGSYSVAGSAVVAQYEPGTFRISMSSAKDLGSLAHEVGHHLDNTLLYNTTTRAEIMNEFFDVRSSLKNAGVKIDSFFKEGDIAGLSRAVRKAKVPVISPYGLFNAGEWLAEGFKMYVQQPQTLQLVAPKMFSAFEKMRLGGAL